MALPTDPVNIETLANDVIMAITARVKSKSKSIRKDDILHPYHQAARWIPLGLDAFCEPRQLFIELEEQNFESMSMERQSFKRKYSIIFKIIEYLSSSSKDDDLDVFLNQIGVWACAARNEDTAMAKTLAVEIIRPNPQTDLLVPPISSKLKHTRGFNHPMTARLLCPRKDLGLFDTNPQDYMTKVNDNEIDILATDFPSFMYDESIPFDPENEQCGLFRGYYALRVFRGIFTGPSSAIDKIRECPKRSKSEKHGMTVVSPETLAYSCVHARFALSSTNTWSPFDGAFDMVAFYHLIISLLADVEDEEVQEILSHWNREAPHLNRQVKKARNIIQDPTISADRVDLLLAQRKKRANRKAAQKAQEVTRGAGSSEGENRGQRGETQGNSGDEDGGLDDERRSGNGSGEGGNTTVSIERDRMSEEEEEDEEDDDERWRGNDSGEGGNTTVSIEGDRMSEDEEDEEDEEGKKGKGNEDNHDGKPPSSGIESENEDGNSRDTGAPSSSGDNIPFPPTHRPKQGSSHRSGRGGGDRGGDTDADDIPAANTTTITNGNSRCAGTALGSAEVLLPQSNHLKKQGSRGKSNRNHGAHIPADDTTTKKSVRLAKKKATSLPDNLPPTKRAKRS